MSEPFNPKTVSEALEEWTTLASKIFSDLSDRESKGWRGDLKKDEVPIPEDLWRLIQLTRGITV